MSTGAIFFLFPAEYKVLDALHGCPPTFAVLRAFSQTYLLCFRVFSSIPPRVKRTNKKCAEKIVLSGQQKPELLTDVFTTQGPCAAPGHVYTAVAFTAPGRIYTSESFNAPGRVYSLQHRGLSCTWTYLDQGSLCCTWTCLLCKGICCTRTC